eukprot:GHVS01080335.1.p1 GENE.GHVS01080335.1~~GHVS01080335.1.p1  ORF type:complete len:746 (+),score=206.11 GHVS01080335.1:46-2283(+)
MGGTKRLSSNSPNTTTVGGVSTGGETTYSTGDWGTTAKQFYEEGISSDEDGNNSSDDEQDKLDMDREEEFILNVGQRKNKRQLEEEEAILLQKQQIIGNANYEQNNNNNKSADMFGCLDLLLSAEDVTDGGVGGDDVAEDVGDSNDNQINKKKQGNNKQEFESDLCSIVTSLRLAAATAARPNMGAAFYASLASASTQQTKQHKANTNNVTTSTSSTNTTSSTTNTSSSTTASSTTNTSSSTTNTSSSTTNTSSSTTNTSSSTTNSSSDKTTPHTTAVATTATDTSPLPFPISSPVTTNNSPPLTPTTTQPPCCSVLDTTTTSSSMHAMLTEMTRLMFSLHEYIELQHNNKHTTTTREQGMSFLDCKNRLLLSYLTYLSYFITLKCHNQQITNHPVIDRLVEIKLLIEKMYPIGEKLRYPITKLLQTTADNNNNSDNGSQQQNKQQDGHDVGDRARPNSLVLDEDEEEQTYDNTASSLLQQQQTASAGGLLYQARKVMAVEYTNDHLKAKDSEDKELSRRKRRLESSVLVRHLREQIIGADNINQSPVELGLKSPADGSAGLSVKAKKLAKKAIEREAYEDDNMTRLPITKQDKQNRKVLQKARGSDVQFGGVGETLDDLICLADDTLKQEDFRTNRAAVEETRKQREITKAKAIREMAKKNPDKEIGEGSKRSVGRGIIKNKGLTRVRSKQAGNARVTNRIKFVKKLKKQPGKQEMRQGNSDGAYGGESRGVKSNVTKSRKLKS